MIDRRCLSFSKPILSSSLGGLACSRIMPSGFQLHDAIKGLSSDVDVASAAAANDAKKTDKPKRPLSAYNFFFQNERQAILDDIPTRTEGKPRRSHGKIGFADLARSIAAKWRNLSDQDRAVFDQRAVVDKERYRKEMEQWKKGQPAKKTSLSPQGFSRVEQPPEGLTSLFSETQYMRQYTAPSRLKEPDEDDRKMPAQDDANSEPIALSDLLGSQFAHAAQSRMETQQQTPLPTVGSPRIADLAAQLGEESTEYFLNLFRGIDGSGM